MTYIDYVDYPWVIAWGRLCGHPRAEIDERVLRAVDEQAPPNAVYYDGLKHRWALLEEIIKPESRGWLIDYSYHMGIPLPSAVLRLWSNPAYVPPADSISDEPANENDSHEFPQAL
jgi:hypothetical protein